MSTAVITLSKEGAEVAQKLAAVIGPCDLFCHAKAEVHTIIDSLNVQPALWKPFDSVVELTAVIFSKYRRIVYVMPTGIVVRSIAPLVRTKLEDPAVVVLDVAGRWAISLLSGHEGGANQLAMEVASAIDAEPIITTTTEAVKTLIAGVGCRRGTEAQAIVLAVESAVSHVGKSVEDIRILASVDIKSDEMGLIEASRQMDLPLRFIGSEEIRRSLRTFTHSDFVQEKVGLPAVAEPAALLAGRRTRLLLPKQIYNGVTVAIARESCTWSE